MIISPTEARKYYENKSPRISGFLREFTKVYLMGAFNPVVLRSDRNGARNRKPMQIFVRVDDLLRMYTKYQITRDDFPVSKLKDLITASNWYIRCTPDSDAFFVSPTMFVVLMVNELKFQLIIT